MDPVLNPYSPGAGRKPAALVGRDQPRSDWNVALDRAEAGRSNQPFVLYGLPNASTTPTGHNPATSALDAAHVLAGRLVQRFRRTG